MHTYFRFYNHLGAIYPFYWEKDPSHLEMDIGSLLSRLPVRERQVDPAGVLEILRRGHLFGDRTLVQGIRRAPWMARPDGRGGWIHADVPTHGSERPPVDTVVVSFREALKREALTYLEGVKTTGILLSGGLDSRIVAGIVRELQLMRLYSGDVVALTWGHPESRDVRYAQEIAKRFNWSWTHFPLSADILKQNFFEVGSRGAELAPFHLHAKSAVQNQKGLDIVLAASYGDSVGRAEFSGRRLKDLGSIVGSDMNRFGLLLDAVAGPAVEGVITDAHDHLDWIDRTGSQADLEIQQQIHYMRRMFQFAMNYIGEKIPVCQMFTAPETFGLMWRLHVDLRDDQFYKALLPTLPGGIGEIPWARTGIRLGSSGEVPDPWRKRFHDYSTWLKQDLHDFIVEQLGSNEITKLGIFNQIALERMIRVWEGTKAPVVTQLDGIVSWLACLAIFVKAYDIQPAEGGSKNFRDDWNALWGSGYMWLYRVRQEAYYIGRTPAWKQR